MEDSKLYFYTSDLCLAAILKTKGYALKGYEQIDNPAGGKRMKFYFEKIPEVLAIFGEYTIGSGDTQGFKNYYGAIKDLKNIIFINAGVDRMF